MGPMLVGHEATLTVATTPVAPLQASVQSPDTARISPGPRFTAIESSDPRVCPARRVTKWTITDAAAWYLASFSRRATGNAARSNVPMPIPRTPTARVSGGSGVGEGAGVALAVGAGVGVETGALEQAATSSIASAASPGMGDRGLAIVTILE